MHVSPSVSRRPRARPLPPEERRAAIIAAATPLITESGLDVSTREVAHAAGIAEGTLFRVFPTKDALIDAVVAQAIDIEPVLHRLQHIPASLPLDVRLEMALTVLQRQIRQVSGLMIALRMRRTDPRRMHDARHDHQSRTEQLVTALVEVIGADADRLRTPAAGAAGYLYTLAFISGHPMFGRQDHYTPAQMVDLMLNGFARPAADTETLAQFLDDFPRPASSDREAPTSAASHPPRQDTPC